MSEAAEKASQWLWLKIADYLPVMIYSVVAELLLCLAVVGYRQSVWRLSPVILVRLGCWVRELAYDNERNGRCGKSPTNNTKNLTSFLVYN